MEKRLFGKTPQGEEIYAYTLTCENVSATILTYGAILQSFQIDGLDVVCGYDTYEGYARDVSSQGAVIGRYANRIANGTFPLNGKIYQLEKNENGITHIHGGANGFSHRIWRAVPFDVPGYESLTLLLDSPDGEGGYPGNLQVKVTYTLRHTGLAIRYEADTDADTVINLTNHSYFNLNGYDGGSVYDHLLAINADRFAAIDEHSIPYEIRSVAGTPFHFLRAKPIGLEIDSDYDQLKMGNGYDHHFYINDSPTKRLFERTLKCAAVAQGAYARLYCYTDQEGVQLYTANFMDQADNPFKNGVAQYPRHAFCLETQRVANSPNHGGAILRAGEHYDTMTVFTLQKV